MSTPLTEQGLSDLELAAHTLWLNDSRLDGTLDRDSWATGLREVDRELAARGLTWDDLSTLTQQVMAS